MPATKEKETGPSKVADFKKKRGAVLTLPSGLSMRVTNPGMPAFIQSGLIPNSLMGIINEAINKGKEADISSVKLTNESDLAELMAMIDNVAVRVAVDPRVHPIPENEEERDEDLLYADELEDEDKLFMFQWATGGTADVERFRESFDQHMDKLSDGKPVSRPAKRTPRSKG